MTTEDKQMMDWWLKEEGHRPLSEQTVESLADIFLDFVQEKMEYVSANMYLSGIESDYDRFVAESGK